MSSPELVKAKKELYTLLLQMRHKDLSSEEVEMLYSLSQDHDIKALRQEAKQNAQATNN